VSFDPIIDPIDHLVKPADPEMPRRAVRLRELGLGDNPDPEFDAFARRLAEAARDLIGARHSPSAMVNFVTDHQFFAGLYATPPDDSPVIADSTGGAADAGREMPLEVGFCPHVVVRRKALVLDDVCDYPRFAGSPLVDTMGIRSYLGAPLIDRTGMTLGTVCIGDTEARPWGRPGLNLIKSMAAELVQRIHQRESGGI
jgi:GAF domain-containing protein